MVKVRNELQLKMFILVCILLRKYQKIQLKIKI